MLTDSPAPALPAPTPLAAHLAALRHAAGLTQARAAAALSRGERTLRRWETGATEPKARDLIRLAQVYGVPVDLVVCAA